MSAAELTSLERATAVKRPLVRLRGQWTLVDAAAVAGLLRLAGQRAEASGGDLLRSALGLGQLDLPPELELAGVEASGPLGTLLAGDLHQRVEALPTPEAFKGELRPYQQRGLGWLVFLGRLGAAEKSLHRHGACRRRPGRRAPGWPHWHTRGKPPP